MACVPPALTYCVVNTNGREDLLACLEAIERTHPDAVEREVLVLDNASTDGSAEAVRARGGGERLIALERREGKAANDSRLMREASGRYCLLLNEDSELQPGATEALIAALDVDPRAGAAGAQLLDSAGRPTPCAWRFPGVGTALAGAVFLHRLLTVQSKGEATRPVDWAQSSALIAAIRPDLAVVRAVGPLQMAAHRPLVLPAQPRHGLLGDLVARRDAAVDAVGAELVEGPGDRQRLGAAADSHAAHIVADQRPELRRGLAEEAVERGEADGLVVALDDDRVLAVLARVAHRPPDPGFGFLQREAVALLHQRLRRLRVVEPAMHRRGIAGLEGAQADFGSVGHAPTLIPRVR